MAGEFTDLFERAWRVNITIGSVARVKDECGVDLAQPLPIAADEAGNGSPVDMTEMPLLGKLSTDMLLLSNVLWGLVKPQAEEKGLSHESFLDALDGSSLKSATEVFWQAYADFFHQAGLEPVVEMINMQQKMMKQGYGQLSERLKTASVDVAARFDQLLSQVESELKVKAAKEVVEGSTSGSGSGKPQESLASTPAS